MYICDHIELSAGFLLNSAYAHAFVCWRILGRFDVIPLKKAHNMNGTRWNFMINKVFYQGQFFLFCLFAVSFSISNDKRSETYLMKTFGGFIPAGNLLVIAFVSYFGAKLHRPKIIAMGCVLMSIGTFIIALPHFIIGRWVNCLVFNSS